MGGYRRDRKEPAERGLSGGMWAIDRAIFRSRSSRFGMAQGGLERFLMARSISQQTAIDLRTRRPARTGSHPREPPL